MSFVRLSSLDDLSLFETGGANFHPLDATAQADSDFLDVCSQPNFRVLV